MQVEPGFTLSITDARGNALEHQMPHMKDARDIYMKNHKLVPQCLDEVTEGNPLFRSPEGHVST